MDSSEYRQMPIHYAAARGHLSTVALIASKDRQAVSATDKIERTALHKACARNCYRIVELLILLGADINSR